jgi:hypothetical protein
MHLDMAFRSLIKTRERFLNAFEGLIKALNVLNVLARSLLI